MKNGKQLILEERENQFRRGYSSVRDDQYINHELTNAAEALLDPIEKGELWPWEEGLFQKYISHKDGRRRIVVAGALLLAESHRLLRKVDTLSTFIDQNFSEDMKGLNNE